MIVEAVDANGKTLQLEISLSPTKLDNKQYIIAFLIDVSKIRKQKKEEEDKRRLYESIVDNSTDHIFKIDENLKIKYINHVAPGLEKNDVLGSNLLSFLPDDENKGFIQKKLENVFQNGKPEEYTSEFKSPNGSLFFSTSVNPIIERGKIIGASLVSRDITKQKKLELAINEKNRFIEKINKASSFGVYIYDNENQQNKFINDNYTYILGYTKKDIDLMTPEEFFKLFHPDEKELLNDHITRVSKSKEGTVIPLTYRFKTKAGEWKWLLSYDTGFEYDEDGKLLSFLGSFTDITKIKEIEKELLQKNGELENFASIVAHDVKSPLNSIIASLYLMEKSEINEDQKSIIQNVTGSARKMSGMVEAILDYSAFEINEDRSEVDFNIILEEVLRYNQNIIIKQNVQVTYGKLPIIKNLNSSRIYQVFQNLLINSINYTLPDLTPSIKVSFRELGDCYCVYFQDNAKGIKKENWEKIFTLNERFGKKTGNGLGLGICKRILLSYNGDIKVKTSDVRGTKFEIKIPKDEF